MIFGRDASDFRTGLNKREDGASSVSDLLWFVSRRQIKRMEPQDSDVWRYSFPLVTWIF